MSGGFIPPSGNTMDGSNERGWISGHDIESQEPRERAYNLIKLTTGNFTIWATKKPTKAYNLSNEIKWY